MFSAVRDVNIGAGTADNVTDDSFVRRLNEGFFTNSATDPTKWRFVPDNDTTVLKGYYYYTEPVEPNESTETLFKQVKVQNASNEDVKAFNVLVYSETVQAQGYADYEAAWADFLSEPVETTTAPEP